MTINEKALKPVHNCIRPAITNLSLNPGSEIIRYARRREDVLTLAQGQGDQPTPEFIRKGAEKALAEGKTFYGPVVGQCALRQEISDYYTNIYGLSVPVDRVTVTASGTSAMHIALTAILNEGDEVVAITPIWKNLLGAVELAQAKIKTSAMDYADGKWQLDLERLFETCTEDTKAIIVNSPSNPTGWVISEPEMKAIMDFARARDIWIISDEVYGRIIFDGVRAPSFLDVAEPEDRLFVVNSFSKNWAMTGWRLGWLIGPVDANDAVRNIATYDNMGAPTFAQFGAIEALRHGEDFIAEQIKGWADNLNYLEARFKDHDQIDFHRPDSTFYAFFRVEGEPNCMDFAKRLIDDVGLGLAPGCSFGSAGNGFVRLCFAVSQPLLEQALDKFEQALK